MKRLVIALSLLLTFSAVDASAQSLFKSLKKGAVTEIKKHVKKKVEKEAEKQINKITNQGSSEQSSQTQTQSSSSSDRHIQLLVDQKLAVKITKPNTQQLTSDAPATGKTNGHEWVDLGLPSGTRWATCNVGASTPEQPGGLYAWGETATKTACTPENSKTHGKDMNDISGNATYDVATAKWGKGWRMPTKEEFDELLRYCDYKYVQRGGLWGHQFTNSKNNRTIFLPSTGYKEGSSKIENAKVCGSYWTSTPYKDSYKNGAHEYHFGAALGEMGTGERSSGFGVRPVTSSDVMINTPASGKTNGHGWVDLGLPSGTKWATCNIGAATSENFGDRYAWGEITDANDKISPKNKVDEQKIKNISGNSRYDAATAKWGGSWRMPTVEDFQELMQNCTWEWTTLGRLKGCKVISKINGNYIFLPIETGNSYDVYWASMTKNGQYNCTTLQEATAIISYKSLGNTFPIRPVTK